MDHSPVADRCDRGERAVSSVYPLSMAWLWWAFNEQMSQLGMARHALLLNVHKRSRKRQARERSKMS